MLPTKIDVREILFAKIPSFSEITEKTREDNLKRIFTGGVRINNGMYRTKQEDAEYREKSLNTPLP